MAKPGADIDGFIDLIAADEVPEGEGRYVEVQDRVLAVFRCEGEFYVTDNTCPHAGGNLAGGYFEGRILFCPWHHWPFDIKTGRCPQSQSIWVQTYPARVESGRVQADLRGHDGSGE